METVQIVYMSLGTALGVLAPLATLILYLHFRLDSKMDAMRAELHMDHGKLSEKVSEIDKKVAVIEERFIRSET